MTLEDDLRAQRAKWDSMKAQWGRFRVPEGIVRRDYVPGVCITAVMAARGSQPMSHPKHETDFERIMRMRYGIKVQTRQPNYRPGSVRLGPIYDEM